MINKDFFAALDALESEKGISKEYFLDALQSALATAYKRNFNEVRPVEVVLDEGKYSIDMYAYRTVVSEVTNPDSEIALQDAKLIKKTCKLGEKLKQKIAPKEFGRIAASTAKQVITQKLREKEKDSAYGEFSSKVDTLMTGIITRIDAGNVYAPPWPHRSPKPVPHRDTGFGCRFPWNRRPARLKRAVQRPEAQPR